MIHMKINNKIIKSEARLWARVLLSLKFLFLYIKKKKNYIILNFVVFFFGGGEISMIMIHKKTKKKITKSAAPPSPPILHSRSSLYLNRKQKLIYMT